MISTAKGAENVALEPPDPGAFGGANYMQDNGYDWALLYVNIATGFTVNGFTFTSQNYTGFSGPVNTNQEGGICGVNSTGGFNVSHCSFIGLGMYGVTVPSNSSVKNCFFNTNAHGIKNNSRYNTLILQNVGWECGGAFIEYFGGGSQINYNSAWACAWGEYDSVTAAAASLAENVYGGSSAYDYSGYGLQTYADIGTLDPDTTGSIDSNSVQLDPLFRNTLTGDLRLQAIAVGNYFTSPAVGAGPGGTDLGAFSFTYGTPSTAWTTIDFSTTDSVGPATGPFRNPDTVLRRDLPIHLSEGDQENGAPYSVDSTQKTELTLSWAGTNPMPTAQVLALQAMFNNPSNQITVDLGGMPGFPTGPLPAYFVRQQGFEYTELTGIGLSDTSVPTPVKEIVLRLA